MTRYKPKHKLRGCNHLYKYSQTRIRFVGIGIEGQMILSCDKCGEVWERKHGDTVKNLPLG